MLQHFPLCLIAAHLLLCAYSEKGAHAGTMVSGKSYLPQESNIFRYVHNGIDRSRRRNEGANLQFLGMHLIH